LIKEQGFNVNTLDNSSFTPLHYAFREFRPDNDVAILQYLIHQPDIDVINRQDSDGYTILHYICEKHHLFPLDMFKKLLDKLGADPTLQSARGNSTPLHSLFDTLNLDFDLATIQYLCSHHRVNLNQQNERGETVLHRFSTRDLCPLPLSVFKCLIDNGADINIQQKWGGNTPLHRFILCLKTTDGLEFIKYMLSQPGIGVNMRNSSHETLLHSACHNPNVPFEVYKLLIEEYGADTNARCKYDNTPIHNVLNSSCGAEVKLYMLSQPGVNVNMKNQYGKTPLHLACLNISITPLEVFRCLVGLGGDFNIKDMWEMTPLHYISSYIDYNCDIAMIAYLYHLPGIDFSLTNKDGDNCIDIAFPTSFMLVKIIVDNDLLKYGSKSKEEYLVKMCSKSPLPIDCILYLCDNTTIDFDYKDDKGVSLLHYIRLSGFISIDDDDDDDDDDNSDLYDENAAFSLIECLINQYINHLLHL